MSSSDPKTRPKPGPWPPAPEAAPVPPSSWAKRTGFRPKFSGETNASDSGQIALPPRARENDNQPDLEAGRARPAPPAANGELPVSGKGPAEKDKTVKKRREADVANKGGSGAAANGHTTTNGAAEAGAAAAAQTQQTTTTRPSRNEEGIDMLPQNVDDDGFVGRHSHMKYELRDTPGLGKFNGFFSLSFKYLIIFFKVGRMNFFFFYCFSAMGYCDFF